MTSSVDDRNQRRVRQVLILADESANWVVAGLRQLDRLALTFQEFAHDEPLSLHVLWSPEVPMAARWLPNDERLTKLEIAEHVNTASVASDLVLSSRLFLYRGSVAALLRQLPAQTLTRKDLDENLAALPPGPWQYLRSEAEIPRCERTFLRESGKSQDGLVSRYLNRPVSRTLSRFLLKLPITPSMWSILIFTLPLLASCAFWRGTYAGFVVGCLVFQLYSVLDGCDGEIARAKFMHSEFGRRLDSLFDLIGNILLALTLGWGLAHHMNGSGANGWIYALEGVITAVLIVTSEGIVFARRSRPETVTPPSGRWNGALYQRHHEFLERSGILLLGERTAWWLVQLTKRDMAMLAFLLLAIAGWPQGILHLLFAVSALTSAFAGNAFLRQPAPAVPQQAG